MVVTVQCQHTVPDVFHLDPHLHVFGKTASWIVSGASRKLIAVAVSSVTILCQLRDSQLF